MKNEMTKEHGVKPAYIEAKKYSMLTCENSPP